MLAFFCEFTVFKGVKQRIEIPKIRADIYVASEN
jgi:hypothetical protein